MRNIWIRRAGWLGAGLVLGVLLHAGTLCFLDAIQRGKAKRTVGDMRTVVSPAPAAAAPPSAGPPVPAPAPSTTATAPVPAVP